MQSLEKIRIKNFRITKDSFSVVHRDNRVLPIFVEKEELRRRL